MHEGIQTYQRSDINLFALLTYSKTESFLRKGSAMICVHFISQVYLDGPFGAPSSDIFRAEHAALIATGIGVTPFSSILQSIMFRYKERPQCSLEEVVQTLKKVDFFWINRDHKSFEWFVNLLDQLETDQRVAVDNKGHERFMEFYASITKV